MRSIALLLTVVVPLSVAATDSTSDALRAAMVGDEPIVGTLLATEGVGCESCHGAGGAYASVDVMTDRARFLARGGRLPDEATCRTCHRDERFCFTDFRSRLAHPGRAATATATLGGQSAR